MTTNPQPEALSDAELAWVKNEADTANDFAEPRFNTHWVHRLLATIASERALREATEECLKVRTAAHTHGKHISHARAKTIEKLESELATLRMQILELEGKLAAQN